jgi:hypothetical protein
MVASDELLPTAVLRQIGDKLYEKRKLAALDVEQLIKRLAAQNDQHRIRLIIDKLIGEYAFSSQANHRKVRGFYRPRRTCTAGRSSSTPVAVAPSLQLLRLGVECSCIDAPEVSLGNVPRRGGRVFMKPGT